MSELTTDFGALVLEARAGLGPERLCQAIPYAALLGVVLSRAGPNPRFLLPADPGNVGNPTLPALHGGAIGGFMEMAAALHLLLTMDTLKVPKVVDFSIDYVRAGKLKDTWAECEVVRQGRRLVNIGISAWQEGPESPIARARAHFLLSD